jgi:hypothetical protein
MRPLRSAPLTCCMYCLADGVPRTEEHLIPLALGSRLTLRDAVCEPCRRLTGRFEQQTLEREFLVPKTLLALKRRRARGKGPSRLPALRLAGDDDAPPTLTLTSDSFPRAFALPAFEPAGLLAAIDRTGVEPRIDFVDCTLHLGTPRRRTVAATVPLVDPPAYAMSIAKWAYALAVAERGLRACDMQPMRDLMRGLRHDVFAFVGTPSPRVRASRDWLHDVSLHERGPWLTATLALFASAGMAPYEIVIGRLHGA